MTTSFLPEDYLAHKAEQRTNIISLTLFGIVMVTVVGAFFFTNRQARALKHLQESVNSQYVEASEQIEELKKLQSQEAEMNNRAVLVGALVERVPRSNLLAELINRMPERLSLLEFEMKAEKIKAPPPDQQKDDKGRLVTKAAKAPTKQDANKDKGPEKVEAPRYQVQITMVGVAPTDSEVSRYMKELNMFPLLQNVQLEYSEEKEVEGRVMRQFKIHMALNPDADIRKVDSLTAPRLKNPMKDQPSAPIIGNPSNTASAEPRLQEGR